MAKRITHRKPGFTETVKTDGGRETSQNLETVLKPSKHYEAGIGEYSFSPRASSGLTAERAADMFARKAAVVSESRETIAGLRNLIGESVSENTLKTYYLALRGLVAFMGIESAEGGNIRLLLEKLDDVTLARYVAKIEAEGKAPATAQMVIAAVRYAAKLREQASPAGRITADAMRGFRRKGAERGRGQARGVTWTQAERIAAMAGGEADSLSGVRDAALILVMSDAMLRISEAAALLVSDVIEETDGSGRASVRRSKTDQEGRGAVLYLGRPTMARVRAWREAANVNDGALFRSVSRGSLFTSKVGETPLSPASIRRILKTRAAQAGIDGVSGHSLRVGAAQSMAVGGATLVDMQIAGRWQSPQMPAAYAKEHLAGRNAVARIRYGCK